MRLLSVIFVWLALLVMLAMELFAAATPPGRAFVPGIGLLMAALVALSFMRLGSSSGLPPAFAMAGIFWLCIMLGLGSMDAFTRHEVKVPGWAVGSPG